MTIEAQYGVPTVAIHTDKFARVVRSVAAVNGMAELRQVFVPQPVMGKSPRELRAYVDGRDPLTGRPVMQEVIEGLTTPLDGRGIGTVEYDRSTPRLVEPDTEENPTPRRTRHRGEPDTEENPTPRRTCTACSWKTAGRITCRSCSPRKSAWPRCWPGRAANRTRSWAACARRISGRHGNTPSRRSR